MDLAARTVKDLNVLDNNSIPTVQTPLVWKPIDHKPPIFCHPPSLIPRLHRSPFEAQKKIAAGSMFTQVKRKKINDFYKDMSLENAPNKNCFGKKHGNLNYSMKATKG